MSHSCTQKATVDIYIYNFFWEGGTNCSATMSNFPFIKQFNVVASDYYYIILEVKQMKCMKMTRKQQRKCIFSQARQTKLARDRHWI